MNGFNIGNWLAALLTGLLLLALLAKWGHKLPKSVKLDDIARLVVAVFCVAGPLYVTPRFHDWAKNIQDFFVSGALGITPSRTIVTIIAAVIVISCAYAYLAKPSWLRLAILVLVTLPLFANDTMFAIAQWWTNNPGSFIFRKIIEFLGWAAGY